MVKKLSTFLSLFLACTGSALAAPDTTKVLFIGNSFTYTQDVPGLVKQMAAEAGYPMKIMSHAPGGVSVGDVSQGNMAHMNNPQVFELIRSDKWNYVVLQDNQGRFVYGDGLFPDPAQSKVVEGHLKIRDSMRKHNPCGKMLLFAGWAVKPGWPDIGDGKKCIENIHENYVILNKQMKEIVSPIGVAWLRTMTALPAVDLWSPDEAHQSLEGSYLTASVIFTSIFRINTENVNFDKGLPAATAKTMRRIAYQSVTDSIIPTALSVQIPSLTYTGTTLTAATGFTKYEWFKNGTSVATGTANTYTAGASGSDCWQVLATDSKGCGQRSALVCKATVSVQNIVMENALSIVPNPATDVIMINTGNDHISKQYTITDITGHIIATGSFTADKASIPVSGLAAGVYYCTVQIEQQVLRGKFIKQD